MACEHIPQGGLDAISDSQGEMKRDNESEPPGADAAKKPKLDIAASKAAIREKLNQLKNRRPKGTIAMLGYILEGDVNQSDMFPASLVSWPRQRTCKRCCAH